MLLIYFNSQLRDPIYPYPLHVSTHDSPIFVRRKQLVATVREESMARLTDGPLQRCHTSRPSFLVGWDFQPLM